MRTYEQNRSGRKIVLHVHSDWSGDAEIAIGNAHGLTTFAHSTVRAQRLLAGDVDIDSINSEFSGRDLCLVVAFAVECRMRDLAIEAIEDISASALVARQTASSSFTRSNLLCRSCLFSSMVSVALRSIPVIASRIAARTGSEVDIWPASRASAFYEETYPRAVGSTNRELQATITRMTTER
jgi:hypothetical protein